MRHDLINDIHDHMTTNLTKTYWYLILCCSMKQQWFVYPFCWVLVFCSWQSIATRYACGFNLLNWTRWVELILHMYMCRWVTLLSIGGHRITYIIQNDWRRWNIKCAILFYHFNYLMLNDRFLVALLRVSHAYRPRCPENRSEWSTVFQRYEKLWLQPTMLSDPIWSFVESSVDLDLGSFSSYRVGCKCMDRLLSLRYSWYTDCFLRGALPVATTFTYCLANKWNSMGWAKTITWSGAISRFVQAIPSCMFDRYSGSYPVPLKYR